MQGKETVTIRRPAETDWQGDPTGPPTEISLQRCQLWPRSSTEDRAQGRVIIEGWNVFVPPGQAEVFATDILVIRGDEHSVVGVPGRYDIKSKDKGTILVTSRTGS
jgi:hypothetical protein